MYFDVIFVLFGQPFDALAGAAEPIGRNLGKFRATFEKRRFSVSLFDDLMSSNWSPKIEIKALSCNFSVTLVAKMHRVAQICTYI